MPTQEKKSLKMVLVAIWVINCILMSIISIHEIWIPKMNATGKSYQNIKADPFDGTSLPITHIPNWKKAELRDKKLDFRNIPINELIPIPHYNINSLQNPKNLIERFTYTVAYMGSYSLNYKEFDGSHLGIDIRAPIGTPVRSIANGVVVRAVEADATGNKFVVIRHENIPVNGKNTNLYSGYLHLSEIVVKEGTKIRKGEMLGRVGMTGITTTPHLHFQIDTEDAPFHPYWPFTGSEAKKHGLSFLQGVSAGLGQDKAIKYTINPLEFAQHYLSGGAEKNFIEAPKPEKAIPIKKLEDIIQYNEVVSENDDPEPILRQLEDLVLFQDKDSTSENMVVASRIAYNPDYCQELSGYIPENNFGRQLSALHEKSCIFAHIENISEKQPVSRAEALMVLMKFYKETPTEGRSHFLDISLADDVLQGYALKASQKGIFKGSYLYPEKIISRGEFIEVLSRFGKLKNRPTKYMGYTDVNKKSTLYNSLQNYAYTIGVKKAKFSPDAPLTQSEMIQMLASLDS